MEHLSGSNEAPASTPAFLKNQALAVSRFHERPAALPRERGLTQQALADMVGVHISRTRRNESSQSQRTLDASRKLAVALSVREMLFCERDERGPADDLRLHFGAASRLDPEDKNVTRRVV